MAATGSIRPEGLPPEARAALARGDKIAAIEILRQRWGLGLAEAKDAVERLEQAVDPRSASGTRAARGQLPVAALAALQHGGRIAAIKAVRSEWRTDLKDSHDAVAAYIAANPAIAAGIAAAASARRRRRLPWLVGSIAVAAAAIYLFARG